MNDEFRRLLSSMNQFYIFGAGEAAKKLFFLISNEGGIDKFLGFLVSSKKENPDTIENYQVYDFCKVEIADNVDVVVSVSEVYHPEVFLALKEKGVHKIISGLKYCSLNLVRKEYKSGEEGMDHSVDIKLSEKEIQFRNEILDDLRKMDLAFGGNLFYQSFMRLGIKGLRKSDIRLKTYNLRQYVNADFTVLDIGCNCGFLDIQLSDSVKSILGIEYNEELVKVGRKTLNFLKKSNVAFVCADYNKWQKENKINYDLILSFAVHIWLDVSPYDYAEQLYNMMNDGGYLLFESQTYPSDQKMFESYLSEFTKRGLKIVQDAFICDDGETNRRWVMFKKTSI